jgi:diguanylate cyclase (GGDEF)-like protein
MAHTDSLTGLMTQRCFYECLAKEWHRSRRSGHPLSCAMIDLDFFKQINDVHGHPAGDQVLKGVAELLQENCRASDSICRYGGEEFCILLPETNENDATLWAERVRQGIARMRITVGLRELRLTASFGVAEWRHDTEDSEQLVDLADQGLLYSKRAGRDRVTRYTELFDSIEPQLQTKDLREGGFGGIVARDVMTPLVVCLRQDETIDDAAQFFLQSGVASTPVLGEGGALAGFISEKDLLAAMISPESWQQPLRNVMRPNVISYEEETPIRTIYEFLCRVSMRRVVITQNGRPTGTISQNSMLRWYREHVMHRPLPVSDGRSDSADEYNTTGMASAPCLRIPDSEPANHSAV